MNHPLSWSSSILVHSLGCLFGGLSPVQPEVSPVSPYMRITSPAASMLVFADVDDIIDDCVVLKRGTTSASFPD
jgi:hypothetical protein